ncbi:sensor histidine kinase [Bacillota bacterium Meth-B3]|nr:HAMP domain-containing sensor histidine kinase [Christensenellaceae bacterium]MEA5065732.1 HAMP domain-containing sensor histidine kinase [Eubacteriales bacterium]
MKMKLGLQARLFLPLAALMIVLPPFIYLTFDLVTAEYAMSLSRSAISSTIEAVKSIVDAVYVEPPGSPKGEPVTDADELKRFQAREFLYETRRALRRSQFESSIIVLNKTLEVVFPSEVDEEIRAVTDHFGPQADAPPLSDAPPHFERLCVDGQEYLACMLTLTDPEAVLTNYLIVFSSINDTGMLLRAAGLVVLVLTFLLALVALIASWLIAASVARPIAELSRHVQSIGAGEFAPTDQVSDVREIALLIEATNSMSARLQRVDLAQKTFFQNASHELRTPLMSIQGYAEGIQFGILDDAQQAAGVIAAESRQLTRVVDGLLTLSRMDNDQLTIEIERIALLPFLQNTIERMRGAALLKGVGLTLEPIAEGADVLADEQLTSKAVDNVLSNAIRYAHSRVVLTLSADRECVRLRISDDGPGIASEDAPRVFDRFFKGQGGLHGVGLPIARSAMEHMGGQIELLPGGPGTTFELRFKRA